MELTAAHSPAANIVGVRAISRGHHKVFLGMAAGVGKTFQMLREGQTEAENGRDVVIGYLEPHGRLDTLAQAEGLETVPRRRVTYRDAVLAEMDLPALLHRAPELALIDELAHTNAPGVEHEKRYEDVEDVLNAGIDVFSTVNVQHLESLNDQVAELTGIRVRETVPDALLGAADEIVLIDITPQGLIDRLVAGKVYPRERVPSALKNFFKVENLAALREVALRQVAEEVEAKRIPIDLDPARSARPGDERLLDRAAAAAVGERLLALVTPEAKSQRVVRRDRRGAVRPHRDRRRLAGQRRLQRRRRRVAARSRPGRDRRAASGRQNPACPRELRRTRLAPPRQRHAARARGQRPRGPRARRQSCR
jgi:two-component system sensor histidine kinase KdpD